MAPKFGALALSRIDCPAIATRVLDAGHLPAICSTCLITCLGPLQRRRVGKLHVDQQIALVLRRDEPRRRVGEAPVGEPEQPAVDHQHQHADPQQPADQAGVDAGRRVEAAVEQEKNQPRRRFSGQLRIQPTSPPATHQRPAQPIERHVGRQGREQLLQPAGLVESWPNRQVRRQQADAGPAADRHEASRGSSLVTLFCRGRKSRADSAGLKRQRVERRDHRRDGDGQARTGGRTGR